MARQAIRLRWLYLALPAGVWLALVALQAWLMAMDPYSAYPWTPPRTVPASDYSMDLAPYLLDVARRGATDTVLIGGSTGLNFTPADIRANLAGARNVLNLSYDGPRTRDMALVLDKLADAPAVKRVFLSLDYQYSFPEGLKREQFPYDLYQAGLPGKVLIFDKTATTLSLRLMQGRSLALPDKPFSQFRAKEAGEYKTFMSPERAGKLTRAIDQGRGAVEARSGKTCADLPMVSRHLLPFARRLSAQGKRLDIVIPPWSLAYYYDVLTWPDNDGFGWRTSLDTSLTLRRCVVEGVAGLAGVRVFTFDDDDAIVADLANYYDPGHVYRMDLFPRMLREVDAGRHQLTAEGFDAYAADLRRRVLAYRYTNSALPAGAP